MMQCACSNGGDLYLPDMFGRQGFAGYTGDYEIDHDIDQCVYRFRFFGSLFYLRVACRWLCRKQIVSYAYTDIISMEVVAEIHDGWQVPRDSE